jgi:hypothetical protein
MSPTKSPRTTNLTQCLRVFSHFLGPKFCTTHPAGAIRAGCRIAHGARHRKGWAGPDPGEGGDYRLKPRKESECWRNGTECFRLF